MAERIPISIIKQLKKDPFMSRCCLCGSSMSQWHHNFEYGRKAINEAWCILPLCHKHHQNIFVRNIGVRRLLDWAMFNRATDEELEKYSKVMCYKSRRNYLNVLFGHFLPEKLRDHFEKEIHLKKVTEIINPHVRK